MENSPAVKYGTIGGLVIVIASIAAYFIGGPSTFLGPLVTWGVFVIYVAFMVKAVTDTRTANGGHIEFGEAFKAAFITFALASLLSVVFTYIMYNFVDPGLGDVQKEMSIEAFEQMGELIGEEGVENAIAALEDQEFGFGMSQIFTGWGLSLVFGAIIAAIVSAIMKRNPPQSV